MKKILAGIMGSCLLLCAGCGSSTSGNGSQPPASEQGETPLESPAAEDAASGDGEIYIPMVSEGFQHEFWQAVKKGAEQAAADFGVTITFEGPETETQIDKQIQMLEAAIAKKPQALCFAPLDANAAVPTLEAAIDGGIPVVGFDAGINSDKISALCATDNLAAGAAAADHMAELIGGKGKVGLIVHSQTDHSAIERRDGFTQQMEEKYPDIEIVSVQYGDGDHLKSTEVTKSMLSAYPDLSGVFGTNEGSTVGMINAVTESDKIGKVVLVGYDSGKALLDGVRSGVVAGAISQDPVTMGYKTVEAAYKAYKGEENEAFIDTGYVWYDASNMDDPEIRACLYE